MFSSGPFWFHWRFLLKFPPAVYRLVTSFLITGPQIGVLLDTYFVYSYLSQLEKSNSKFTRKEDLIWYLMVVGSVIIVGLYNSFHVSSPTPCSGMVSHLPCHPVYPYWSRPLSPILDVNQHP